jgi:hypothetical protein
MRHAVACLALLIVASGGLAQSAGAPAIKKSEQGICHERGSPTYKRTKHFEPYDTMEACLASGGRAAKNAVADGDDRDRSGAAGSSWLSVIGKKALVIIGMLVIVASAFLLSRRRGAPPPQ